MQRLKVTNMTDEQLYT